MNNVVPFVRPNPRTLGELFEEDLAKSGIPLEVAEKKCKFKVVGADEAWAALHPKKGARPPVFTAMGYLIPYYSLNGRSINYQRFRKLSGRFSKDDDGSQRYSQPTNTMPHIYVPPIHTWGRCKQGDRVELHGEVGITEGEKKAIKAWLCGLPYLALGGVDSYQSARYGQFLLDEFEWFDWTEADVCFTYDSDVFSNPNVRNAMYHGAAALRRAHHPRSIYYRQLTGETSAKQSLDDFLAAYSSKREARSAYEQLPRKDDAVGEAFATFDAQIAHVVRKTRYYNIVEKIFYPSQKQISEQYAVGKPVLDGKKEVFPIALWFTQRDTARTTVRDVVYAPGKPARFTTRDGDEYDTLNEWWPSPLEPVKYVRYSDATTDVAPYIEFIDYLTQELTSDQREALLDWAAYPLQHLGATLDHAVVMWSKQNGTGKNTFARILKRAYGNHNVWEFDGSVLDSRFNDWTACQFVIVNEIHLPTYNERTAAMARLKTLITDETVRLERKNIAAERIPNCVNAFLSSNEPDALPLQEDDRRFFVIHVPEKAWTKAQWTTFNKWLDRGGYEKVYGYLLARNLRDFNPHGDAPRTRARAAMIACRSGAATDVINDLVDQLWATPGNIIARTVSKSELFTPGQLVDSLSVHARSNGVQLRQPITTNALGASMRRHDFAKRVITFKHEEERRDVTLYAVINSAAWSKQPDAEWRTHFREWNKGTAL